MDNTIELVVVEFMIATPLERSKHCTCVGVIDRQVYGHKRLIPEMELELSRRENPCLDLCFSPRNLLSDYIP